MRGNGHCIIGVDQHHSLDQTDTVVTYEYISIKNPVRGLDVFVFLHSTPFTLKCLNFSKKCMYCTAKTKVLG